MAVLKKGQTGKTLISIITALAVLAVGVPLVSAYEAHTVNVTAHVKDRPHETLVKTMTLVTDLEEIAAFLTLALDREPPIPNFPYNPDENIPPTYPNPWLPYPDPWPPYPHLWPPDPPPPWPASDNVVPINTFILWVVKISVSNTEDLGDPCWTDVIVKDNFSAELGGIALGTEIVDLFVKTHTRGKSKKEVFETQYRITWYVTCNDPPDGTGECTDNSGTLCPGQSDFLELYLWTKLNPAGQQEYTSPGTYTMNSGPNVKWYVEGQQFSFDGEPLDITVNP